MNGQENTPTLLCANGCGFYGSLTTKNLCSKCYREFIKVENQMKQQQPADGIRPTAPGGIHSLNESSGESRPSETGSEEFSSQTFNQSDASHPIALNPSIPSSLVAPTPSDSVVLGGSLVSPCSDLTGLDLLNESSVILPSRFSSTNPVSSSSDNDNTEVTSPETPDDKNEEGPVQKNRGRCFQCNKKVGLLGFTCRCGFNFCGCHRHADQHSCQFDYRELARQQLTKANQKVVADKLNRI